MMHITFFYHSHCSADMASKQELSLTINCGFARVAIYQITTDMTSNGGRRTPVPLDARQAKFQLMFRECPNFGIPPSYFNRKARTSQFDRHCSYCTSWHHEKEMVPTPCQVKLCECLFSSKMAHFVHQSEKCTYTRRVWRMPPKLFEWSYKKRIQQSLQRSTIHLLSLLTLIQLRVWVSNSSPCNAQRIWMTLASKP